MIRFLVLVLLAVCAPAFAAVSNVAPAAVRSGASSFVVSAASDGTPIASAARSVVAGATSGEFLIRDMFAATGPAGSLPLQAARTVSGLGAARAIAAVAARGVTPVAVGMTAYDIFQSYRMRSGSGGLEQDLGVDPFDDPVTEYTCNMGSLYPSSAGSQAACVEVIIQKAQAYSDSQNNPAPAWSGNQTRTLTTYSFNTCFLPGSCYIKSVSQSQGRFCSSGVCGAWSNSGSPSVNNSNLVGTQSETTITKKCPSVIDSLTGQSITPGVAGDGKCLTGRYDPITEEQAAAKLAQAVTPKMIEDYLASPSSPVRPIEESKPMAVTGPAEQVGPPKTVTRTGPTGMVSETVTPTYQYNYAGNTITYNTVNQTVTNITNNEGDTTTETKTEPVEPQKGDCELYPKSVGCLELGETPDEEVPEQEREVEIEPEEVDLPSGCPADVALPGGRVLSYAAACAAAEDVAPLVIAAGVLSALLIAVAAIRGG